MNGIAGMHMFKETIAKMENVKQLFSKSQKLKLAALKRKGQKFDVLGDWTALVDEAITLWYAAIA